MMAKPKLIKGFSLSEMLIVIIIISLFNVLTINKFNTLNLEALVNLESIKDDLINKKFVSLRERSRDCLIHSKVINKYPVCFNQKGNVNMARTLLVSKTKHTITVFLGAGVYEHKKR